MTEKIASDTPTEKHRDHLIQKVKEMNTALSKSGLKEYVTYLESPVRVFVTNFLAGIARGFGFILGATVVVAIVVYILGQILSQIPFIGDFFSFLNQFIQENLDKYNLPRT